MLWNASENKTSVPLKEPVKSEFRKHDCVSSNLSQKEYPSALPSWKRNMLIKLRKDYPNAKVTTLLPSKTGTWTLCELLETHKDSPLLDQYNHTHCRRAKRGCINIMLIRHPIDRIKSYIDYIASRWKNPTWCKWQLEMPERLPEVRACALNDINTIPQRIYSNRTDCVNPGAKFPTNVHILRSQTSYVADDVVCLTLKEIPEAIQILLKLDSIPSLPHANKSSIKRPPFNKDTIAWLKLQNFIKEDIKLWNKWT